VDAIRIVDLPLGCRIGAGRQERAREQTVRVDIELRTDVSAAAAEDDIAHAIDYVAVCRTVAAVAAERDRALIETLAEDCARELLARFPAESVRITLRKPSALAKWGAAHAAVEIERRRDG
jgi:dihydroneopterin aldolase